VLVITTEPESIVGLGLSLTVSPLNSANRNIPVDQLELFIKQKKSKAEIFSNEFKVSNSTLLWILWLYCDARNTCQLQNPYVALVILKTLIAAFLSLVALWAFTWQSFNCGFTTVCYMRVVSHCKWLSWFLDQCERVARVEGFHMFAVSAFSPSCKLAAIISYVIVFMQTV